LAPIPVILCEYLASGVVGPNIRGFRLKTYMRTGPAQGGRCCSGGHGVVGKRGGEGLDDFGQKTLARIIIEKWPDWEDGAPSRRQCIERGSHRRLAIRFRSLAAPGVRAPR